MFYIVLGCKYQIMFFFIEFKQLLNKLDVEYGECVCKVEVNEGIDWKALSYVCCGGF